MSKTERVTVSLLFDTLRELKNSNDRSLAIVGAALVESLLAHLINSYLIDDESKVNNKVDKFINNNDFSSKIQLAYCLGLISKDEYNDFNCIRDIRNLFAHRLSVSDLNNDVVKSKAQNFIIAGKMNYKNDNLREMLLATYVLFSFQLIWRNRKIKRCEVLKDDGYEKIKKSLENLAPKFGDFLNYFAAFFKKIS